MASTSGLLPQNAPHPLENTEELLKGMSWPSVGMATLEKGT